MRMVRAISATLTYAAVVVREAVRQLDLFPIATGATQLHGSAEAVRIRTSSVPSLPCTSMFGSDVPALASKLVISVPIKHARNVRQRFDDDLLAAFLLARDRSIRI
ncbi:hypothetical protein [Paenibacillus sp. UMB7766-LJ446]|uniref:hypothetical protein n=1 Tax=Paenibacillus sp. UMB7766-LJ446 TaxID=3046313 RepID=UPI003312FEE0